MLLAVNAHVEERREGHLNSTESEALTKIPRSCTVKRNENNHKSAKYDVPGKHFQCAGKAKFDSQNLSGQHVKAAVSVSSS